MPIPGPGTAISINTIATEFGGTTPHSISEYYRGGGLVPNTPGNAAIPTSGQIALGDFYGSANRVAYTLTISANTQNYDVYTNRGPSYVAGSSDITVQINPGVVVGSSSVPAYAMLVPSAFSPTDTITIVNNGSILGTGGSGGAGGLQTFPPSDGQANPGSPGNAGGNALYVNRATTVTNNGTIASGGGGGGGGASVRVFYTVSKQPPVFQGQNGGGGGGGAGNNGGAGGSGVNSGSAGTSSAGGAGGSGATSTTPLTSSTSGTGGNGGGLGSSGSSGGASTISPGPGTNVPNSPLPGGSGGAAGNYITGNSFVTWPANGTRLGGVA